MAEKNPNADAALNSPSLERYLNEADTSLLKREWESISMTLLYGFAALMVTAGIVGWLHSRDFLVAMLLSIRVLWRFYIALGKEEPRHTLLMALGFVVTALAGSGAELWGIHYGYWTYHDLSDGHHFPCWLPIAWGGMFLFIYRIESRLLNDLHVRSMVAKTLLVMMVASVFPTWGEIVAINLGVWTYTWGWQLFGVPLLAITLLIVLHTCIFFACSVMFRRFNVRDALFNP